MSGSIEMDGEDYTALNARLVELEAKLATSEAARVKNAKYTEEAFEALQLERDAAIKRAEELAHVQNLLRGAELLIIFELKNALEHIASVLGPGSCTTNNCQGCCHEMDEAFRTAQKALETAAKDDLSQRAETLHGRISALERHNGELRAALTIYANPDNFVQGNDWVWKGDDDPTLPAKRALASVPAEPQGHGIFDPAKMEANSLAVAAMPDWVKGSPTNTREPQGEPPAEPIKVGDTVRHKKHEWTATVGYIESIDDILYAHLTSNVFLGFLRVSELERVEPISIVDKADLGGSFYQPKSIAELALEQNVKPIESISELRGIWPVDESDPYSPTGTADDQIPRETVEAIEPDPNCKRCGGSGEFINWDARWPCYCVRGSSTGIKVLPPACPNCAGMKKALASIVDRYECEEKVTGRNPERWGLTWAMYTDAKDALDASSKAQLESAPISQVDTILAALPITTAETIINNLEKKGLSMSAAHLRKYVEVVSKL